MKDFRLFDVSDFVIDEDFFRWVNEGKNTDNEFWRNWLSQNPDKYMAVAEARRILESIGIEKKVISDVEKRHEIQRLLLTIKEGFEEPELKARVRPVSRKVWYAVAATVLFAVVSSAAYFLTKQNKRPEKFAYTTITNSGHFIENVNTSEKPISLKLPDQSTVELSPNSRIAYANNFDSTGSRDIYLSGEAFFKVTKNPNRPFRVFANEIVTKVLGTSFIVSSFEKDTAIQVTVRTGKVSVYSQTSAHAEQNSSSNQPSEIILTPNQKLVYEKSKQKFQKVLLENPVMILPDAALEKSMFYEDASLEKVFNQLNKIYGINIVYDNELLRKCTVTADLRDEPFYRKLDLICKAVGARYEIIDGQVVIQSSGCE